MVLCNSRLIHSKRVIVFANRVLAARLELKQLETAVSF
jgi:hypothetical protein